MVTAVSIHYGLCLSMPIQPSPYSSLTWIATCSVPAAVPLPLCRHAGCLVSEGEQTCDWVPHEGDDVMLVGQGQAPATPKQAHSCPHLPRPLLVAREPEHLAAAHVIHWAYICAGKRISLSPYSRRCSRAWLCRWLHLCCVAAAGPQTTVRTSGGVSGQYQITSSTLTKICEGSWVGMPMSLYMRAVQSNDTRIQTEACTGHVRKERPAQASGASAAHPLAPYYKRRKRSMCNSPTPAWIAHLMKPLRCSRNTRSWSMVAPS